MLIESSKAAVDNITKGEISITGLVWEKSASAVKEASSWIYSFFY